MMTRLIFTLGLLIASSAGLCADSITSSANFHSERQAGYLSGHVTVKNTTQYLVRLTLANGTRADIVPQDTFSVPCVDGQNARISLSVVAGSDAYQDELICGELSVVSEREELAP